MSRMPSEIFVTPHSPNNDGLHWWTSGDTDPRMPVRYEECAVIHDEDAWLAVEQTPGFGYGVIGPIELMVKPNVDGVIYDNCRGYATFYRQKSEGLGA